MAANGLPPGIAQALEGCVEDGEGGSGLAPKQ